MTMNNTFSLIEQNRVRREILHNMINQLILQCSRDKALIERYNSWTKIGNSLGLDPVQLYADQARRTIDSIQTETLDKISKVISNTSLKLTELEQ